MPTPPGLNLTWREEKVYCGVDIDAEDGHGNEMAAECVFEGEVEVCLGDGLKTWECPECFYEHEESWSPEDDVDPDAWRD